MRLSVVIPCHNEESRLGPTLDRILGYLRSRERRDRDFHFEVIVVDDGSLDCTAQVAERPGVVVVRHAPNEGKGSAVRRGTAIARGEWALVTDADLSTPIEEVEKLERFTGDFDIVIGSRAMLDSIVAPQPPVRRIAGAAFRALVSAAVLRGFRDTQCGFKLMRTRIARRLLDRQRVPGFAFDVEMLYLARRNGVPVKEVGVRWADARGSTVRLSRDVPCMIGAVARIRLDARRGLYESLR